MLQLDPMFVEEAVEGIRRWDHEPVLVVVGK